MNIGACAEGDVAERFVRSLEGSTILLLVILAGGLGREIAKRNLREFQVGVLRRGEFLTTRATEVGDAIREAGQTTLAELAAPLQVVGRLIAVEVRPVAPIAEVLIEPITLGLVSGARNLFRLAVAAHRVRFLLAVVDGEIVVVDAVHGHSFVVVREGRPV